MEERKGMVRPEAGGCWFVHSFLNLFVCLLLCLALFLALFKEHCCKKSWAPWQKSIWELDEGTEERTLYAPFCWWSGMNKRIEVGWWRMSLWNYKCFWSLWSTRRRHGGARWWRTLSDSEECSAALVWARVIEGRCRGSLWSAHFTTMRLRCQKWSYRTYYLPCRVGAGDWACFGLILFYPLIPLVWNGNVCPMPLCLVIL